MEILETLCCHNSFLLNFYSKLNFVNYLKMNKIQIKNIKVCSKVLSFIHSRVVLEKKPKTFLTVCLNFRYYYISLYLHI